MDESAETGVSIASTGFTADGALACELAIERAFVDDPDVTIVLRDAGDRPLWGARLRDLRDVAWLPRGRYALGSAPIAQALRAAAVVVDIDVRRRVAGQSRAILSQRVPTAALAQTVAARSHAAAGLALEACPGTTPIGQLSWTRDHGDWFHRHFDHAARTVSGYMLGDHALLQGRILDVGCGDGITDLGLALHCEPELLVGIDPFGGFRNLPRIMAENHIPADAIPACLQFATEDGNNLPYPDDSFDVVISWGSLEHIAGGHAPCLKQIRRVLRDGGLLFAHPGLYYSNLGHHLGEFSSEPFVHLRRGPEDLRQLVMSKEPQRIDRSGHVATSAEYWQWYQELNKITVGSFEQEMRALGFEPWRVALRTEPVIEYTPEILHYPMQDLATAELYTSWWNRKPRR